MKLWKHVTAAMLAAGLLCVNGLPEMLPNVTAAETVMTVAETALDSTSVYNAMIALQAEYPSGTVWTNDQFYIWNGGIYGGGYGCAAFAFMLSDAAFGTLPARITYTFDPSTVRVGDILRYSAHSFIVLEVRDNSVIAAEGNVNGMVYWGREVTFAEIEATFEDHMTRYPEDAETTDPPAEIDTLGDLNGDGNVNAVDASHLLIAAANTAAGLDSGLSAEQIASADVNGDGNFNAADASIILMYAAYAATGGTLTLEEFVAS